MNDAVDTSRDVFYGDIDKWNKLLFENANKNHLHQDGLRWTLAGGFGAFFYYGITVRTELERSNSPVIHYYELLIFIIGTLFFVILLIEGWYYNLYLAHLAKCEMDFLARRNLTPLSGFDRKLVQSFHPSFWCVLLLVSIANTYHLVRYLIDRFGDSTSARDTSAAVSLLYVFVLMVVGTWGRIPQRIDATLAREERRRYLLLKQTQREMDQRPPSIL